jgi:hypothetical protein
MLRFLAIAVMGSSLALAGSEKALAGGECCNGGSGGQAAVPAAIMPGDAVVVAEEGASLRLGDRTLATLSAGRELRVLKVQGPWVGASVDVDGQKVAGWVWMNHLTTPELAATGRAGARRFSYEPEAGVRGVSPVPAPRFYGGTRTGRRGGGSGPVHRDAGAKARGEFGH